MKILKTISENKSVRKPVIYGLSGLELTDEEKYFFSKSGPIGFILFARNIQNKNQTKKLIDSLKNIMNGEVLILIDQEGGRVARLTGEDWKIYPHAKYFSKLYEENKEQAQKACYDNSFLIARDLSELGINLNCAPVLDILTPNTHEIIGDRAFGDNPKQVANLARQMCSAFLDNKIYPVIKHIPGHGRASCDSHLELPIVDASLEELINFDFIPFIELKNMKFAMTAHILYSKIDNKFPATISKKIINLIRNQIGFKNILMSDDISMKALKGKMQDLTKAIIGAGCDLVLHCNGKMNEMEEINQALPFINNSLLSKLED